MVTKSLLNELTLKEQELIVEIFTVINITQRNQPEEAVRKLGQLLASNGMEVIIKQSFKHESFNELCKSKAFDIFWTLPQIEKLDIQPQKTVDRFDILKGRLLYLNSKNNNKDIESKTLLSKALELNNFSALSDVSNSECRDALMAAQKAAALYGTPGYLLLANFHMRSKNYQPALVNLLIAKELEPFSTAMIHNVGKSYSDIFLNFSDNWENTIENVIKTGKLNSTYVSIIEKQAITNFNNIKDNFERRQEIRDIDKDMLQIPTR